ncbi:MAG: hypothetical protein ACXVP3_04910 [Actinomycetota bacterium]
MRRSLGVVAATVVVALIGFGIWHHLTGPRFTVVVRPRPPMTESACVAEVTAVGYGSSPAARLCKGAVEAASYVASVTNTGGRGAWLEMCGVDPVGESGTLIEKYAGTELPMWVTSPGVGARPYVAPGHTVTLDWFVKGLAPGRVVRYAGSCGWIAYDQPPI